MEFSRFGEVRVMIFRNFGGPGGYFRGLGTNFHDFSDFCNFVNICATKGYLLFEVICDTFWMQFLVFF